MGVVQPPDELQQVFERQVAEGRAASPAAFLKEAVMRLLDEAGAEEAELRQAVEAGSADIDAGHHTTVTTPDDQRRLHEAMMPDYARTCPPTGSWPTGSPGWRNSRSMLSCSTIKQSFGGLDDRWTAVRDALPSFTPVECTSHFAAAGYKPE